MTPHSLTALHEYMGTEFDGEYITKIDSDISVGLCLGEFVVYVKNEKVEYYPADKIVRVLQKMRKQND